MKIACFIDNLTGLDLIDFLVRHVKIDFIVYFDTGSQIDRVDLQILKSRYGETDICFLQLESNKLTSIRDMRGLTDLGLDLIILTGWRRLLNHECLKLPRFGTIGAHGSPFGMRNGRGRSPMNWALILGEKNFQVSIYFVDEGIDSGQIIDTRNFQISNLDDVRTLYLKSNYLIASMLRDFLPVINTSTSNFNFNPNLDVEGDAFYFPKRSPNDGALDWHQSSESIYDKVRALVSPYPNAFTFMDDYRVKILKGVPVSDIFKSEIINPGTILAVTQENFILVKTQDSTFLITNYVLEAEVEASEIFKIGSVFSLTSEKKILKEIIDSHNKNFPDLPINPTLIKFSDDA
jgi:methionyl-tRNA formyltransferase